MNLRRFLPRIGSALLVVAAFILSAALAHSQTYNVNFTTPWKEGQAFHTSVKVAQRNTISMSEGTLVRQEVHPNGIIVHFEAESKALSLFPHGGLHKVIYTVRSLRVSRDNSPEADYLPANTLITVETISRGVQSYFIGNQVATDEQKKVLKFVTCTDEATENDQMIWGPTKLVGLSETWQPDLERLKKAISNNVSEIPVTTGVVKLEAVEGRGDKQIAIVSGNVVFSGFPPPFPLRYTSPPGDIQVEIDDLILPSFARSSRATFKDNVITGKIKITQTPPSTTVFSVKSNDLQMAFVCRIPAIRTGSKRDEDMTITSRFVGETKTPPGTTITLTVFSETKRVTTLTFP